MVEIGRKERSRALWYCFDGDIGVPGFAVYSPLHFCRPAVPSNLTDLFVPKISQLNLSSSSIPSFLVALGFVDIPGSKYIKIVSSRDYT